MVRKNLKVLENLLFKDGEVQRGYNTKILKREEYRKLKDEIFLYTSFIETSEFSERIFLYYYKITSIPMCPICSNIVDFVSFKFGHRKTCCKKCASILAEKTAKKNCMDKYGVENHMQRQEVRDKLKDSLLKKYGVENVFQSKEIKEKIKESLIEKYGADHPQRVEKIKNKTEKTNLKKYGVRRPLANKDIYDKMVENNINKYGFENQFEREEIKEKSKETMLEKYGVHSPAYLEEQINRLYQRNMSHVLNKDKYDDIEFIQEKFVREGVLYADEIEDFFNITTCSVFNISKKLKFDVKKSKMFRTQLKIFYFIKSLSDDINISFNNLNILDKKELDIMIEYKNKKIAIEYNGLMYHSFGVSNYSMFNNSNKESTKKYNHIQKTIECEELGIHLLHINENEWLNKQELCKSMIKSKLGIYDTKIYARKCELKKISFIDKKEFFNNNHMQGDAASSLNYGLYYQGELVSAMSFSKARMAKDIDMELIRFASKLGVLVIGGGSRLLKAFQRDNIGRTLISYADRRWTNSESNFYIKNGFKFLHFSKPTYQYFKVNNSILYNRQVFQKYKIKKYYEKDKYDIKFFDESLTERENMYLNGYRRIYNSGQLVYVLNN